MKKRVAVISVGLYGHGHNLAFAPNAAVTIAASLCRGPIGDQLEVRLLDEVLLGHSQLKVVLEDFVPDVLLVGVPMTGYYSSAVDLYQWAGNRSIPVLTGGYHFNIPDTDILGNQSLPGIIARTAAMTRGVVVCYGDGECAATGFLEHCLDPQKRALSVVPNLCYTQDGQLMITPPEKVILGSQSYPRLPLEVFDPRSYWGTLSSGDVHASGHDKIGDIAIGRTVVGAKVVNGCTYRHSRMVGGKEGCSYCTLTSRYDAASGADFWRITQEMIDYIGNVPWQGAQGIRCYQIGDDMGSDTSLIRSIWEQRPGWTKEVPLGHRLYAWHVLSESQARMLRDIGVRWLNIGGDGKEGFTHDWSSHHPLVRSLDNCRKFGLTVSLGFVLGQYAQGWSDIEKWIRFVKRINKEYGDILIIVDGWVNVVAPGSPDWRRLCKVDPSFLCTDCPDLERARLIFWERCTQLCAGGKSPEEVRRLLYDVVTGFENDANRHPGRLRSWMLPLS